MFRIDGASGPPDRFWVKLPASLSEPRRSVPLVRARPAVMLRAMPSQRRRAGSRETAPSLPQVAAMPRAPWAWWVPLATALAGVAVFRGALGLFFAQDDFAGLARAAGVLPRLQGPWRYLSGQLYFDVMHRLAGMHAWPYHAAGLAAHVACGVLLAQLLARRFSRTAAAFGAIAFVTHPAPFTAIYSVSGIGELLGRCSRSRR